MHYTNFLGIKFMGKNFSGTYGKTRLKPDFESQRQDLVLTPVYLLLGLAVLVSYYIVVFPNPGYW